MNKKMLVSIIGVVILAVGGYVAYQVFTSRPLSPEQTTSYSYSGLDLKVVYCRPSKRGRVIFGDSKDAVVPNGKYWRLGANGATEITLSKDVTIVGKLLKAGSYRVYSLPKELSWEISFNSELGKWGYDEPDYSKDVLKVEVPVEKAPSETEQFTITFTNDSDVVNMNLDWDKTHVRIPITVQ